MTQRRIRTRLLSASVLVSVTAVLATLTAQGGSPPRPAVDMARVTLGGTVWPADFTNDGVADLAAPDAWPLTERGFVTRGLTKTKTPHTGLDIAVPQNSFDVSIDAE